MSRARTSILPVLLVNFIGTMGFSIVLPFLVYLVTRVGGNAVIYGLMVATYPAFQLVGAPLLGRWSDRIGRKKTLLISQAGTLLAWGIFALALSLPASPLRQFDSSWLGAFTVTLPLLLIFTARALDGLTGGNISVANAYLADITSEEDRSKNFGRMGMSSSLGFILGPALASLLAALGDGEAWSIYAALAISLLGLLAIIFMLTDSRPERRPGPSRAGLRRSSGHEPIDCTKVSESQRVGLAAVLRQPGVARVLCLYFLIFLGFSLFYVSFPVRVSRDLEWSVGKTGLFFTFMSGLMVLVQGPLLSRLARRVSETRLIVLGNLLLAVSFLMLMSEDTTLVFAAALFFALGNGTMWPTIQAVLSKMSHVELQGATQGFAGAAGSLASIVGLFGGGLIYERIGDRTFVISCVLFMVVALLAGLWCRGPKDPLLPSVSGAGHRSGKINLSPF
ncbi:MAG: MFS transporter [Acidobacteriota bacterium]|nr:MFS transporter [Acidobacteriota bacterium]MDH3785684.1 MFS transporter [Acidobacteriota bacterium]